jgi:hypothetical protein
VIFGTESFKPLVHEIPKKGRYFRIQGIIRPEERLSGHSLKSRKAKFSDNRWCALERSTLIDDLHFGICQELWDISGLSKSQSLKSFVTQTKGLINSWCGFIEDPVRIST